MTHCTARDDRRPHTGLEVRGLAFLPGVRTVPFGDVAAQTVDGEVGALRLAGGEEERAPRTTDVAREDDARESRRALETDDARLGQLDAIARQAIASVEGQLRRHRCRAGCRATTR